MGNTVISVKNCSYAYPSSERRIFDDLSLDIEAGQFVGILGSNGTGKSTLLKVMCGLFPPLNGQVFINSRNIAELSRRQIAAEAAFVPQEAAVWLPFTCRQVVEMGLYARSSAWSWGGGRNEVVDRCMADTSTSHLAERRISELSGGEAQRVRLAQALAQETSILLLDEPTSHLDICFQIEVMDLAARLNRKRGLTVVIVLHDLNLAAQYCSRLVVMHKGRIEADGSPERVMNAELLRRVFGVEADIDKEHGRPRIYLKSGLAGFYTENKAGM